MLKIGTWMAGQAKFCALYEKPFWRETGLSGQGFSQRGPMGEIHDGSNNGQGPYGLTGFVGIPAAQRNQQQHLIPMRFFPNLQPSMANRQGSRRHSFITIGLANDSPPPSTTSRRCTNTPSILLRQGKPPLERCHPFCRHGNRRPARRLSRRGPDRSRTGGNEPLRI